MKKNDLVIRLRDPLILRDGRPFGQAGNTHAGSLNWPGQGTVIGMLRHYIGRLRQHDYFDRDRENHIREIRNIQMEWFLPLIQNAEQQMLCFPAPADAIAYMGEHSGISVRPLIPQVLSSEEGTDIPWLQWMYPRTDCMKKPVEMPLFWKWEFMRNWLTEGKISEKEIDMDELGIRRPDTEYRIHVCIDVQSGSASESRLFHTGGIRLQKETALAACIRVEDTDRFPEQDMAFLGGDRRGVNLEWSEKTIPWPDIPPEIGSQPFLRLILNSPGVFSRGWAPECLLHSLEEDRFIPVPGTDVPLRLRSACIPRWQALHGWDMSVGNKMGGPKAMRKMVPAGAVYFVETEPGVNVRKAAEQLWNLSLCENEQDRKDGWGRMLVGNWNQE